MMQVGTRGLIGVAVAFTLLGAVVPLSQGSQQNSHLDLADRQDDRPYSHAVLAGHTLYVAGTLGIDPATGVPPKEVAQEIRIMMDGIQDKLRLAGMSFEDVVNVEIFCTDMTLYDEFNSVYGSYFNGKFPARAFVGSGPLRLGARFEMTAIAVKQ